MHSLCCQEWLCLRLNFFDKLLSVPETSYELHIQWSTHVSGKHYPVHRQHEQQEGSENPVSELLSPIWGAFKGSDLVAAAKVHRNRSQTFESSWLNASLFTTPEQWSLQVVSESKLLPIGVDPEQGDEQDGSPCSGGARAISHRSQKGSTEWNGTTSGLNYPEHWRLSSAWKHCRKRCLSPWLPPLERPLLDELAPLHTNILLAYNIIAKQETCGCMHRF